MKLFTNSYLNEYNILKNAKIGFEFEAYSLHNYPITLEILNRELVPLGIKVWGFKEYHPNFKPDANNFIITPDISGGFQMLELVTGPLEYTNSRIILTKILNVLQKIAKTTDRSSLHINISFPNPDKNIEKLNILKLILNIEETKIYEYFPDRKNNLYAKSVKNIIPFKDYDYTSSSISTLLNSLTLPITKYYGVNFSTITEGRLEYRYIGGENYQFKVKEILDLLDYFTLLTWNCIAEPLDASEAKLLREYLDENIRKYKSMSKLNDFMGQFPSVEIQVDKKNDYEIVSPYYSSIYENIFDLISNSKKLVDLIINFDTETRKIEIVSGEIEFIGPVENFDFIACSLKQGDFTECSFIKTNIDNSILITSKLIDSDVLESKLLACDVDKHSSLKNTYFTEGFLDGQMEGGVFRSGKLGENGYLSKETKILNEEQNFFNVKIDKISKDKTKKGFSNKKGF